MSIPNIRIHVWYLFGVLLAGCLSFLYGYSKGYKPVQIVRAVYEYETIHEKIVEVQKLETRIVWRTTKKPDGTVITDAKQEQVTVTVHETEYVEVKEKQELETISVPSPTFSIGFGANSDRQPYGEVGYKVFGNAWVELQGSPKELSAGFRLDW
jgi:hypothetical protein